MKHFLAVLFVLSAGCSDQVCNEDGDNLATGSRWLAVIDDESKRSTQAKGTLSSCNATEYLHYYAEDTGADTANEPSLQVTFQARETESEPEVAPPTLEACVYVACWYGATELEACNVDGVGYQPVTSPQGFKGCCQIGSGTIDIDYQCDNGLISLVSDDDADFFVHLCTSERPQSDMFFDYSLTATF